MAPELVRGEAARPEADVWSLGATLYVAVEGRPPFAGDDAAETLAAVLHDPPPPPRRAGRLGPLLARLLARDPADRPSHDAIRTALAEVSLGTPAARAATAGYVTAVRTVAPVDADAEATQHMSAGTGP
jgi:serine/threonine protein kinase